MRKLLLALFLALSLAVAHAGWVAQIYGTYGKLDYSVLKNASVATKLTADNIEYPGHYGNYVVSVTKTPATISVLASGDEESVYSLTMELAWLSSVGAIPSIVCKDYTTYNVSESGYEGCNGRVLMFFCPSCEISQAASAADSMGAANAVVKNADEVPPAVPPEATAPAPAAAQKYTATGGAAENAESMQLDSGMKKAPDGKLEQGIGFEQVLQLLAAFIAVIVASYLLLQSRQDQGMASIDPQAERLLANETRAGIMAELSVADKIPTDLSAKLRKSKAAVVEHLAELVSAGLVDKIETPGKKFVYYRLTQKGRRMLLRRAG